MVVDNFIMVRSYVNFGILLVTAQSIETILMY